MITQLLKNEIKSIPFHSFLDEEGLPMLLFWKGNLYWMHKHHTLQDHADARKILLLENVKPPQKIKQFLTSPKFPGGLFVYVYS